MQNSPRCTIPSGTFFLVRMIHGWRHGSSTLWQSRLFRHRTHYLDHCRRSWQSGTYDPGWFGVGCRYQFVLGCVGADFCKQLLGGKVLTRSTRFIFAQLGLQNFCNIRLNPCYFSNKRFLVIYFSAFCNVFYD